MIQKDPMLIPMHKEPDDEKVSMELRPRIIDVEMYNKSESSFRTAMGYRRVPIQLLQLRYIRQIMKELNFRKRDDANLFVPFR